MKFKESNVDEIVECLDKIENISKDKQIIRLVNKIMGIIIFQQLENFLTDMKEKDAIK